MTTRSTLFFCAILAASAARGATLFSVTAGPSAAALGGQPQPDQILAEGWTDSSAESNVLIEAPVQQGTGTSITAYLMNQIGPGTTISNEIAATTFAPIGNQTVTLFSGLNLAAGSYYVVMIGNGAGEEGWFAGNGSNTLVEGPTVSNAFWGVVNVITGNSHGTPNAFAPASTFFNASSEAGTFSGGLLVETTPEPSTMALLGTALVFLGAGIKRMRLRSRKS